MILLVCSSSIFFVFLPPENLPKYHKNSSKTLPIPPTNTPKHPQNTPEAPPEKPEIAYKPPSKEKPTLTTHTRQVFF